MRNPRAKNGVARVYLVGGGPGDPGLLTVRAVDLIAQADAIVYDALISTAVLERRSPRAELIYVGKRGGEPSRSQEEINRLLVECGRRYKTTVRLKGGDPFIFGRGGEEALALREAGIAWEVVPGITSGIAAPAYAGVPLTHRMVSSSVAFVTGHEDPAKENSDIDWTHLARGVGTLVFYMSVSRMADNFRRLIDAGRAADTPAAVIEWGTYPRQRTVVGTLDSLPARADEARISAPAIVVVGEVVALRDELAWFENRPLSGKRILVTRARAQASEFATNLQALGAEAIQFPTIRIVDIENPEPLRRAAREIASFDWLILTSVNGVERFWRALREEGLDARALANVDLCAIGPATAAAIRAKGVQPDLVPESYIAEAVVDALADSGDLRDTRILLPRAETAREVIPERLQALGAEVIEVAAYRTVSDGKEAETIRSRLAEGEVDMVTFTASSTVKNFVELIGTEIGGAEVASIGPITSRTARELGLPVHVEAEEYTIPGLLAAIRDHYGVAA